MANEDARDGAQEALANIYRPPGVLAQQPSSAEYDEDRDLTAVTPTSLCRAASIVAIGTALYTLLMAFQAAALVRSTALGLLIATVMVALGSVLLIAGWKIRRLHGRATWVGLGASGVIGLLGASWFVVNLVSGVANLMPLIVLGAALLSLVFCGVTLTAARQADAARARLAEHGVELGS